MGDITGLYMIDDEGELVTVEVQAMFVNGKPDKIQVRARVGAYCSLSVGRGLAVG